MDQDTKAVLEGIKELVDERFRSVHKKLDDICEQTTKTNGRVTKLEEFKNIAKGVIIVMNVFFIPLVLHYIITSAL